MSVDRGVTFEHRDASAALFNAKLHSQVADGRWFAAEGRALGAGDARTS